MHLFHLWFGINNGGQVVGSAGYAGPMGLGGATAFLYSGGAMQSLGLLPGYPPGGYSGLGAVTSTTAAGINDGGQIVGNAFVATGGLADYPPPPPAHAFLYSGGVMQDLGTLPGGSFSEAYGINQSGQVVGGADNSSGYEHAFLWSNGTMQDLGTLSGGPNGVATAINNAGQVAGYADNSSGWAQAFLYSNGTMQGLGTLPGSVKSEAWAINQSGQIVGETDSSPYSVYHAFIYTGGRMIDLNSLIAPSAGWTLESATGINDLGQIVGDGVNPSGQTDAFLLTPTPEPSTLCLSIICGPLLLAFHLCCRGRSNEFPGGARG